MWRAATAVRLEWVLVESSVYSQYFCHTLFRIQSLISARSSTVRGLSVSLDMLRCHLCLELVLA